MSNYNLSTEDTDCPTSDLKIQINVSKSSLLHNIKYFQDITNRVAPIIPVVKANAYGHGVKEVLLAVGDMVDGIQVDDLQELVEARNFWQKRVLVLGIFTLQR